MQVETEQKQESPGDHQCTAAHELKEVKALTRGAFHDGLYADERGQRQKLGRKTSGKKKKYFHILKVATSIPEISIGNMISLHSGMCDFSLQQGTLQGAKTKAK